MSIKYFIKFVFFTYGDVFNEKHICLYCNFVNISSYRSVITYDFSLYNFVPVLIL